MEHDLVIEGRLVLPDSVQDGQVGITEGLICEVKRQGLKGSKRIRAEGCLVLPGFIDSHVHLREPGWEHKEDFRTGTMAAIHGGVTTVLDMPNNPRPTTNLAALKEKERLAGEKALVNVRFYAGVQAGKLSAIPEMKPKAVGYKIYLARTTGGLVYPRYAIRQALSEIAKTGRPVGLHCEDQGILDAKARELAGQDRPDIHCDLRPPESEVESVRMAEATLARAGSVRANVCHVSTQGALEIIKRSRVLGRQLFCEVTLHHLFFNRSEMMQNKLLKTNPPLRSEGDRVAMMNGLRMGKVDFLVTDHAPHTREEKVSEGLAGVPGLDDYGHLVSWLVKAQGLDPVVASRVTAGNPASFFGLGNRGELRVGLIGDVSILDLDAPEKVTPESVQSKCGWSPYEGHRFPGRTRWTVKEGRALLEDFQITV